VTLAEYSSSHLVTFQVTRQASATKSGINLLPFMLAVVLSVIIAGQLVARIGRYWPFLVCGPPVLAIGSGLLYTIDASTSDAKIIGFQILAGVGVGSSKYRGRSITRKS
jgi:MFS family permease